MWIARDKDGTLHFFSKKPDKGEYRWKSDAKVHLIVPSILFPKVRWEDEEPTEYSDEIHIRTYPRPVTIYEMFNKRTFELEQERINNSVKRKHLYK